MAIRRFNYTGRVRLRSSDLRFRLHQYVSEILSFDADLDFSAYTLPGDAEIYVEAYRQTERMRFPWGSVSLLLPPDDRDLSLFSSPEGIAFRVKIVGRGGKAGLLVADRDGIRPRSGESEDDVEPLLPVKQDPDLGHLPYRVDFTDRPVLCINSSAGDWRAVPVDSQFASLVLPAVLREVLFRIILVDKIVEKDDESWQSKWLRFTCSLPMVGEPPVNAEDSEDVFDWVDNAVGSFARQNKLLSKFLQGWNR